MLVRAGAEMASDLADPSPVWRHNNQGMIKKQDYLQSCTKYFFIQKCLAGRSCITLLPQTDFPIVPRCIWDKTRAAQSKINYLVLHY